MQDVANHVAFGYFTVALLATAAVAFAAGVQFLVISVRQPRDATHLAFAMLCLCVAGLAFADAWSDVAGTLATTILALHIFCAAAVLALAALVIFVGSYTGMPANRYVFGIVGAFSPGLLWANLQSPYSMFYTTLRMTHPLVLPWGESLYAIVGTPSVWSHLFYGYSYAVFLWAPYRAARQYHAGQRLRGGLLGLCLVVQFLTLLWVASSMPWVNPAHHWMHSPSCRSCC